MERASSGWTMETSLRESWLRRSSCRSSFGWCDWPGSTRRNRRTRRHRSRGGHLLLGAHLLLLCLGLLVLHDVRLLDFLDGESLRFRRRGFEVEHVLFEMHEVIVVR